MMLSPQCYWKLYVYNYNMVNLLHFTGFIIYLLCFICITQHYIWSSTLSYAASFISYVVHCFFVSIYLICFIDYFVFVYVFAVSSVLYRIPNIHLHVCFFLNSICFYIIIFFLFAMFNLLYCILSIYFLRVMLIYFFLNIGAVHFIYYIIG